MWARGWKHVGTMPRYLQGHQAEAETQNPNEKPRSASRRRLSKTCQHHPICSPFPAVPGCILLPGGQHPALGFCQDALGLRREAPLRFAVLNDLIERLSRSSRGSKGRGAPSGHTVGGETAPSLLCFSNGVEMSLFVPFCLSSPSGYKVLPNSFKATS